jgi:hypothetical protein
MELNTIQNPQCVFSNIRNGNINIGGIGADKDYSKIGEFFQVLTV